MKSKKIAFYIASLVKGGAQRVIVNVAQSLLEKGHKVIIVTTYQAEDEYALPAGAERIFSDITEEEATGNRMTNLKNRFFKLRNIWKKERPDVIVSFIGKNNFMTLLTAWGLSIPVITSVRGDPKEEYYNKAMELLAKTLMGKSAGLILQTPDAVGYFPRWIQKKAVILENPLNPAFIDAYPEGERENAVVTVGRIDSNKNQKLLIDAFARIADEFPETKLFLYGDGEDRAALTAYVKSLECGKQIALPGNIGNVKEVIQKVKLFVLPSNTEGMPNALMEALALGIPAVSTDCPCGGPRMLMEGKENGILVPVKDAEAMAAAMKTLLRDEKLWQKYSRNAHRLSKELHPDIINPKWEAYLLSKIKK